MQARIFPICDGSARNELKIQKRITKLGKIVNGKLEEAKNLVKADETTAKASETIFKSFESTKAKLEHLAESLRNARKKLTMSEMKTLVGRRDELKERMNEISDRVETIKTLSVPKLSVKASTCCMTES